MSVKSTIPGHEYELKDFEQDITFQTLRFVQKEPIDGGPEMRTIMWGTTNEDVLEMLIDRLQFLQMKFPCRENSIVLTHLETALLWLNKRTADRKKRGVEGKHQA